MQLIANGTQGPTALPTKRTPTGAPGYANNVPGATSPTIWDPDVANTILNELKALATAAGAALDPSNNAQCLAALVALFGRLASANNWTGANTFTASGATSSQIFLNQTGGGHNWDIASDSSGNLLFYDVTTASLRLSISAAGVSNFPISPTIPDATSNNQPVALGQFNFLNAGAGYYAHPKGMIIQWGTSSITATGAGLTGIAVALPIVFPNNNLFVLANWAGTTPPPSGSCSGFTPNTSQAQIVINAPFAGTYGVGYIAVGY